MFHFRITARAQNLLAMATVFGLLSPAYSEAFSRTPCIGSPSKYPDDEQDRVKVFEELHGEWPPPWTYPGGRPRAETETAGWAKMMEDLESGVRALEGKFQWERWLDVAQMHLAKNYSAKGYHHAEIDADLHGKILDLFKKSYASGSRREGRVAHYIHGEREMWHIGKLGRRLTDQLLNEIRRKVAEWLDVDARDLVQTSYYGFRVFRNGSVVQPHVERLSTHVLTAAYCLDVKQEQGAEPWLAGHEVGIDGESAWVDLRPGELLLYESAKMPHARPSPFVGDHYALLNVYFTPKDWRLEEWDRMYAVPEDYQGQKMTRIEPFPPEL